MPQLSYRQELDLLENIESALEYNHAEINVDEIAQEIANEWPSDYYADRVIQWLHAGQPDIDDTAAGEWTDDITKTLDEGDTESLTKTLHTVTGVILQTLAFDYLGDVIELWDDTNQEALTKIHAEINEHRAHIMEHDGLALTAPYQFHLTTSHSNRYTVHVTVDN